MANIILAEDDASLRNFIALALEKAGHAVSPCADGLEAMAVLESAGLAFDILLTDIVMPGIDGVELAERATALFPSIKILFITGFAAASAGGGPGGKVIAKPFHLSGLLGEIDALLAS